MKEYYFVSEGIVQAFSELEKSEPFKGTIGGNFYVAVIDDFDKVKEFVEGDKKESHFAYQLVDSAVSLLYDVVDYDAEDNEIQTEAVLNKNACEEWGLLEAIEYELGLTKEINIAYALYKLAKNENVNPIEFVNSVKRK